MPTFTGTSTANVLNGGAAADRLLGLGGNDTLNGAGGHDTLDGGGDVDLMVGGSGNDTYTVDSPDDVIVEGAAGGVDDTVLSVVSCILAAGIEGLVLGGAAALTATGNASDNHMTGNAGANQLFGLDGADSLRGGGGNDTLHGASGNDTLDGWTGNDHLIGGRDHDVYIVNSLSDVVVEVRGQGGDTVRASVSHTLTPFVENLILTGAGNTNGVGNGSSNHMVGNGGANKLSGLGSYDILEGGGGNDTLNGGRGDDTLNGGDGDDSMAGGDGLDIFYGGAGNDRMVGEDGHDRYYVDSSSDVIYEAPNHGFDVVESTSTYVLGGNVEKLILVSDTAINGTGNNTSNNEIVGNGAANLLKGLAGNDTLSGGGGNDTLDGGSGVDSLIGGSGDDYVVWDGADAKLDGGTGTDTLVVKGSGAANMAGLFPSFLSPVKGFEIVDLAGVNTLVITAAAIQTIATANVLRVDGDAGDAVNAGTGWTRLADIAIGDHDYAQYAKASSDGTPLTLQVALEVNRDGILTIASISLSDLDGTNGFRVPGLDVGDRTARSIAHAGDLNGDGYDDFIMGAPGALDAGQTYVVFGAPAFSSSVDLEALNGTNGFRLDGVESDSGFLVGGGDINGDGMPDITVSELSPGATYVVFGGSDFSASFSLSALDGANGFRLDHIVAGSGSGDVNGDGYGDLRSHAGIIFGGPGFQSGFSGTLNGTNGFAIEGNQGGFPTLAGDVNGDGFDDVIVGWGYYGPGGSTPAEAYVVFGGAGLGSSLSLDDLDGAGGFRLEGLAGPSGSDVSVSSAGDVNGDGFADIIIGVPHFSHPWRGGTYVVFGASTFASSVDVSALDGGNGFRLEGVYGYDGLAVASAGDVNGDGYDDFLIGAAHGSAGGINAGETYLVFGASTFASAIDLGALDGTSGFRLDGFDIGGESGSSLAPAGDVNGDGFSDFMIGAPSSTVAGYNSGETYVVFGRDFTGAVEFAGTADPDDMSGTAGADRIVAGRGNDTMTGGGGADVFRGGEGDDRIIISDAAFSDVDGGNGSDALVLDGGFALDLTGIADSKVTGIEVIDLGGTGNALTVDLSEVLKLSDTSNVLIIEGGGDDEVTAVESWDGGEQDGAYYVYTLGAATLKVSVDLDPGNIHITVNM